MSLVRKFVGRFGLVGVIDPRKPTKTGPELEMDATMNTQGRQGRSMQALTDRSSRRAAAHGGWGAASRRRLRDVGLVVLVGGVMALALAPAASAGTYVIDDCPSAPVPNGAAGAWQIFGAPTAEKSACSGGVGDFIGPLGGKMSPNSSDGVLIAAPSGITISAVQVYWHEGQSISGAHTYAQVWSGSTLLGEAFDPVDHTYTPDNYTLPAGATNFSMQTYCSSDDGSSGCELGSGSETPDLKMFGAQLTLNDSTPPSGTVTGGNLAGGGSVTGIASLSYLAQDSVSGVRVVRLRVDGKLAAANEYTPSCPYDEFLACPASETNTISWNTASIANGNHYLQLTVEDAAQNTSVIYEGTITTQNQNAGVTPSGAPPGPGAGTNTTTAANNNMGAANGANASETAQLQLGLPRTITRTFAHRALTLSGRLLSAQSQPMAGATLDILQQVAGAAAPQLIAHAQTGPDGTFTVRLPAGPSRLIEVGYRAFSGDASYTVVASVKETVQAGVRLKVSPRRTGPEGTIVLSGTVEGPIPHQGAIVDLLVHYRGRWEPFRTPRTNARGRFHVVYQFEGGVGRFPFRAEVPGGQAGFPFASGNSRVVHVSTN
jgi:hypothetical protein